MGILLEVSTATLTREEANALQSFLQALYPTTAEKAPVFVPQAPNPGADLADKLIVAEAARVAALVPAPGPAPVTNPGALELDAEGLPWDARIHSEAKGKLKEGTWKLKRNIDTALVAQVKAELKAALGASPQVPVGQAPAFVPGFVPPAPAPGGLQIQVEGQAPGPVIAHPAPQAAATDAAGFATATFADVMSRVVDLTVAGVGQDQVNAQMALIGLAQPRDLAIRPDLVPAAMAVLATLGA